MKNIAKILITITALFCSLTAVASGTGTWGGSPPAPTAIIIKFHIPETDPIFAGQLAHVREVVAQFLAAGKVCQYAETKDTIVVDGPLYQYVRIEFYDYGAFLEANKELSDLDSRVEKVSGGASTNSCGANLKAPQRNR